MAASWPTCVTRLPSRASSASPASVTSWARVCAGLTAGGHGRGDGRGGRHARLRRPGPPGSGRRTSPARLRRWRRRRGRGSDEVLLHCGVHGFLLEFGGLSCVLGVAAGTAPAAGCGSVESGRTVGAAGRRRAGRFERLRHRGRRRRWRRARTRSQRCPPDGRIVGDGLGVVADDRRQPESGRVALGAAEQVGPHVALAGQNRGIIAKVTSPRRLSPSIRALVTVPMTSARSSATIPGRFSVGWRKRTLTPFSPCAFTKSRTCANVVKSMLNPWPIASPQFIKATFASVPVASSTVISFAAPLMTEARRAARVREPAAARAARWRLVVLMALVSEGGVTERPAPPGR
jgi:hypothetical protein